MSRGRASRRQTGGRAKAAVFLLVSLGAAVGATVVIYSLIKGFQEELAKAQEKESTVQIVVARSDLHPGQTITTEDLMLFEVAPDFVPDTVFFDIGEIRNRVPRERILQHEFIRAERLAEQNAGAGLNAIIPRGMRAQSINVTDASSVAGFINPGNFVDVLVTIRTDRKSKKTITLLQAVRVLAVNNRLGGDQESEGNSNIKPSVTLAVSPSDVEKIALSQAEGEMTLTLRADVDVGEYETHGASASTIIGRPRQAEPTPSVQVSAEPTRSPAPATPPKASPGSVQIIHGGRVEEKTTNSDGSITSDGKRNLRKR